MPIKREFDFNMFQEELRQKNINNSIEIMRQLVDVDEPKWARILFYYLNNMRDEFDTETRLLA